MYMDRLSFWAYRLDTTIEISFFSCNGSFGGLRIVFSVFVFQIDAAINSGNSGGPAFNDKGKCVGIAFQSLKHEDAENIGYVIPTPVIVHFIQDYEKHDKYTGKSHQ